MAGQLFSDATASGCWAYVRLHHLECDLVGLGQPLVFLAMRCAGSVPRASAFRRRRAAGGVLNRKLADGINLY